MGYVGVQPVEFLTTSSGFDLNGTDLILDADDDTKIKADNDDRLAFEVAGTECFAFTPEGFIRSHPDGSPPDYTNNFHYMENGSSGEFVLSLDHVATGGSDENQGLNIFFGRTLDATTLDFIKCSEQSTERFHVNGQGDVNNHDNAYGALSDERLKTSIVDSNSQWNDIKSLKVRNFKKKDDVDQYGSSAKSMIGLIAQEAETVSAGLVKECKPSANDIRLTSDFGELNEDGSIKSIKSNVKTVQYSVLYMKAVKALQEAMARIETLETKVAALEG